MVRVWILAFWGSALFSQQYTISTVAGQDPDGSGSAATTVRLWRPAGVASDGQGGLFIADSSNRRIRRVTATGTLTTIAGGGTALPEDGATATTVSLISPYGVAFDSRSNTVYFSDSGGSRIWAVALDTGRLTLIAGAILPGFSGDGGPSNQARLSSPRFLAFDNNRNLLVADSGNHRIRRIDLANRTITTVAGNGNPGFGGDGAAATNAQLRLPYGVAVARDNSIYIADWGNSRIRRIQPNGNIETYAGNGSTRFGGDGGPAVSAAVDGYSVAIDGDGNVLVSDYLFDRVRRIAAGSGIITTYAGTGSFGFSGEGGAANLAQVYGPSGLAVDGSTLLVADSLNHRVRRINLTTNAIQTIAGRSRYGGDDGPATEAFLSAPTGIAVDSGGNVIFSDEENHVIRRIGRDGRATAVVGRGGFAGFGPEGVPALSTTIARPQGVAIDTDGTLYYADFATRRVRRLEPSGNVRTVSGRDIYGATGLAIDRRNRVLYFTDSIYNQILKIDLNQVGAEPTVIAGSTTFQPGFRGDGGPASAALLRGPRGIALAANGDLIFADTGNNRIRRIDNGGQISTLLGTGEFELEAVDGPLTSAATSDPRDVQIDGQGNIFFVEGFSRVRRIAAGRVETIAGQRLIGSGFTGDGGLATAARLDVPQGLAIDGATGNIYIADTLNNRIRMLTPVRQQAPAGIQITRGNNQSGTVGTALGTPLTVRVTAANSDPIPAVRVSFTVLQGAATLSAASVNTIADGTASVTVTLGATAGTVQVSARVDGLSPAVFTLTATAATGGGGTTGPTRPAIARQGVIGVGASVPAVRALSPRGIVSIFGQNFLPTGTAGRRVNFDTELVNGQLPTRLLGVCVEMGAVRAPLLDVFATQLNVVVPNLATANAAVRVITNCDAPVGELISEAEMVPVAAAAPEFLYAQINSNGVNPVAAANAVTGALVGPAEIAGFTPARPGDILTIYATGLGATDPAIGAGAVSAGIAGVTGAVRVQLGERVLEAADVLYVGASPGLLIYQLNIRVPEGTPVGNQPLRIFVGEAGSPVNAFLAVAAPAAP